MGSEEDWKILALHNRNVGLLFEDDELFARATMVIPEYAVNSLPLSRTERCYLGNG